MKSIFRFLAKVFIRAAMDKALQKAVKNAVVIASGQDSGGEDKMKRALSMVEKAAPQAFEKAGKKEVRLLIEAELNRLL